MGNANSRCSSAPSCEALFQACSDLRDCSGSIVKICLLSEKLCSTFIVSFSYSKATAEKCPLVSLTDGSLVDAEGQGLQRCEARRMVCAMAGLSGRKAQPGSISRLPDESQAERAHIICPGSCRLLRDMCMLCFLVVSCSHTKDVILLFDQSASCLVVGEGLLGAVDLSFI